MKTTPEEIARKKRIASHKVDYDIFLSRFYLLVEEAETKTFEENAAQLNPLLKEIEEKLTIIEQLTGEEVSTQNTVHGFYKNISFKKAA